MDVARVFAELGLSVLERGWLSSNNVVFEGGQGRGVTVVDTSYSTHSEQTLQLVAQIAGTRGVERVVNTHLHSDHCGGNAVLQSAFGCEVWVPETLVDAVRSWDASTLTFELTDQRCDRFRASRGLSAGDSVLLGRQSWEVLAVDGHDPDSLVFFHRASRVLISADALWEDRLAIIFPAIDGRNGFAAARRTLESLEGLNPAIVVPGHGRPFVDVAAALAASRRRLDRFEADPAAHLRHAARALAMFHLLDRRSRRHQELVQWLASTPVFVKILTGLGVEGEGAAGFAESLVAGLVRDGLARMDDGGLISVNAD